jgi:hypothetical protein
MKVLDLAKDEVKYRWLWAKRMVAVVHRFRPNCSQPQRAGRQSPSLRSVALSISIYDVGAFCRKIVNSVTHPRVITPRV